MNQVVSYGPPRIRHLTSSNDGVVPDWWLFTKGESRNPNVSPASETIEKTVIKPFGLVAEINRGRSRAITATAANVAAAVGTIRTAPAVAVVDCKCGGREGLVFLLLAVISFVRSQ